MCFGSRKNLTNHKRVHTEKVGEKKFREKKYSCNICSKVFTQSSYRDQHVALHSNPNPLSCEYCSRSFNYKKLLLTHVRRLHPNRHPFKCKLCSKTYDSIRKIDLHISSLICDKKGELLEKLANRSSIDGDGRMKVDNTLPKADKNIKLFVCNMCDEEFLSVGEIQCHFNSSHKRFK
jgi:DNA-directed RNA polymerase subunit RPC12/RpoP